MNVLAWIPLAASFAGIAALAVFLRNRLARRYRSVESAFHAIDVSLRLRQDEIPPLVDACRAFTAHDRDELDHLLQLHASFSHGPTLKVRIGFENEVSEFLCRVQGSFTDHLDLERNDHISEIRARILEHELAASTHRVALNAAIASYNAMTRGFPLAPVAVLCGFPRLPDLEPTAPELAQAAAELTQPVTAR